MRHHKHAHIVHSMSRSRDPEVGHTPKAAETSWYSRSVGSCLMMLLDSAKGSFDIRGFLEEPEARPCEKPAKKRRQKQRIESDSDSDDHCTLAKLASRSTASQLRGSQDEDCIFTGSQEADGTETNVIVLN